MAKILSLDDMLALLEGFGSENLDGFRAAIRGIANQVADEIRDFYGVASMPAYTPPEEGGVTVSFYPAQPDQPCPDEIDEMDVDGEWLPKSSLNIHLLRPPA